MESDKEIQRKKEKIIENKIKKVMKKPTAHTFKHTVFSIPQFFDPMKMIRIKFDFALNWNKAVNSDIENLMYYKEISNVNFITKYNVLDSLEIEFKNCNKYSTPKELILDRMNSLNDEYAKQFGEIVCKYLSNVEKPVTLDYKDTKEYQNYLKRVEKFKSNHYGEIYTIVKGKYDEEFGGIEICNAICSRKFLDIIYEGNMNELYNDFLENKYALPFLGYIYNGNRFQYFVESLINVFDPSQKAPIDLVDLTKDGYITKKAQQHRKTLNFFDPKDPTKLIESHTFNNYKCLEPAVQLNKTKIPNLQNNEKVKKNEEEIVKNTEIEKKNSDFLEKYYKTK